jgi:hypothetical protein
MPSDVSLPSGLRVSWRDRIATWRALAGQASTGGVSGSSGLSFVPATYGEAAATDELARLEVFP